MHRAPAVGLRHDRGRLTEIVGIGRGAPAERAAGPHRMDAHLVRRRAQPLRRHRLLDRLELRAGEEVVGAVGRLLDRAVQRLQRGVGEEGEGELHLDHLGGGLERVLDRALLRRQSALRLRRLAVVRQHRCAGARLTLVVPHEPQRVPSLSSGVGVLGEHRDALRHHYDIDHALHGTCRLVVDALQPGAKARRPGHHRRQHVGAAHVKRVFGRAVGLHDIVDAVDLRADQREILGVLQLDVVGHRLLGGGLRELAEGGPLAGLVGEHALLHLDLVGRHLPGVDGGLHEHGAGGGAGLAQLVPAVVHGGRAAGSLHAEGEIGVELGVGRRELETHLRPVGVELLGDDGGEPGGVALPHVEVLDDHRHGIVGRDPHKGVGLRRGTAGGERDGLSAAGRSFVGGEAATRDEGQAEDEPARGGASEEATARGLGRREGRQERARNGLLGVHRGPPQASLVEAW